MAIPTVRLTLDELFSIIKDGSDPDEKPDLVGRNVTITVTPQLTGRSLVPVEGDPHGYWPEVLKWRVGPAEDADMDWPFTALVPNLADPLMLTDADRYTIVVATTDSPTHTTNRQVSSGVVLTPEDTGTTIDLMPLLPMAAATPTSPVVKGDTGDPGPPGPVPVLSAEATTLAPGSSATAAFTGPPETPLLTLGIPRGDKGAKGDTDLLDAAEAISARLQMQTGSVTVGVASDSTANGADEWARLWTVAEAARRDDALRVEYCAWNPTTETYTETVIQEGEGTPATGGVDMEDAFDRAAGPVVGSTSTSGHVWAGSAGVWQTDGAGGATTASPGVISYQCISTSGSIEATVPLIRPAPTKSTRIYIGSASAGLSHGVWATISDAASYTALQVWKTVNGASERIYPEVDPQIVFGGSPTAVTVTITLDIQNVTITWDTGTETGQANLVVEESDYAEFGPWRGATSTSAGGDLAHIKMESPYTPPQYRTLRVLNAAVAGANLDHYTPARLAQMFPEPVDVMMIGTGHNMGTQDGDQMRAALGAFTDDVQALHPEVKFLLTSQNPQYPPAVNIGPHAERQLAARLHAREKAWTYAPVFERFLQEPDGGLSLVNADGVHPAPAGSQVWADVIGSLLG